MKQDLDDILSLIAATVFADKRIYACEIEAFVTAANRLKIVKQLDPQTSETKLLKWYEANKDRIRRNLETPYFKDWFYRVLERLKNVSDKKSILEAMRRISISDGHVHVSERALMALSERYWSVS